MSELTPLILRPGIPSSIEEKREPYQQKLALYLVLASVLFERIAFHTLGDNLVPTLQSNQTLGWDSDHGASVSLIFSGTRYVSSLCFAALCDAKLGRTVTITIGFAVYAIGYTVFIFMINTHDTTSLCSTGRSSHRDSSSIFDEPCSYWILSILICTGIAAGIVQANVTVFGGEQIRKSKSISKYADRYMIAASIGDMLTIFVVPYIKVDATQYYFITNLVCSSMLFVAIILFFISCHYAIHVRPYDSALTKTIPVIINAFQSWRHYKRRKSIVEEKHARDSPTTFKTILNHYNEDEDDIRMNERPESFLDFAKAANRGKYPDRVVNDVKSLRRGIFAFFLLFPYWLIYIQVNTTFLQQASRMNLFDKVTPGIWITLIEPITILLGIFILRTFVYKYLETWKKEKIIVWKLAIGMLFACLAMCTSGIVEIFRQKYCTDDYGSSLNIYYQIPQNILIGISEIFAVVGSSEYAYFAAPQSALSLFMSLRFATAGIAAFVSTSYSTTFLKPADEDSMSNCFNSGQSWRYHTYYFILAGIQIVFLVLFIICHKKYRVYRLNPQQIPTSLIMEQTSISLTNRK